MQFSVLICTHNRSALLARALDALDRQLTDPAVSWEIVVVDNASSDRTAQVVAAYRARARVPVEYHFEPRLGHSIALNVGIDRCQGEIIAFTDDDACPSREWIQQLRLGFERYQADWVYGKVTPLWDAPPPRWFSQRFYGLFALLDYGQMPFLVTDARYPFFGVNHAVRRAVLAEVGGYREDWGPKANGGSMGADIDLFERALAAGKRIWYLPEASVEHIIPRARSSKMFQRRKIWVGVENYYPFLRKTVTNAPWLLGLPRYLYRQAVDDLITLGSSLLRRDQSTAFHHELQLVRFVALMHQAARHGFRTNHRLAS